MTTRTEGSFQAKVNGVMQTLDVQGGQIVDASGRSVEGAQIEYPKWHPTRALTAAQKHLQALREHHLRAAEVTRDEMGDVEPTPALPVTYGEEPEDDEAIRLEAAIHADAAKNFSAAEKDAIINEGTGGAGNLDRLSLDGTHYQVMAEQGEDNPEWMWN